VMTQQGARVPDVMDGDDCQEQRNRVQASTPPILSLRFLRRVVGIYIGIDVRGPC
jgi:hypothetical protein